MKISESNVVRHLTFKLEVAFQRCAFKFGRLRVKLEVGVTAQSTGLSVRRHGRPQALRLCSDSESEGRRECSAPRPDRQRLGLRLRRLGFTGSAIHAGLGLWHSRNLPAAR